MGKNVMKSKLNFYRERKEIYDVSIPLATEME